MKGFVLLPGFAEVKVVDGPSFDGGSGDVEGRLRVNLEDEGEAMFAVMDH